jgi:hypothetical protein
VIRDQGTVSSDQSPSRPRLPNLASPPSRAKRSRPKGKLVSNVNLEVRRPVNGAPRRKHDVMPLAEIKHGLTRAASSTCGRLKSNFLSVILQQPLLEAVIGIHVLRGPCQFKVGCSRFSVHVRIFQCLVLRSSLAARKLEQLVE